MSQRREWQVLLLGGASGVGKTSISSALARHYGVGITEVDDFQIVLERMTTGEEQPVLHFWRTNRDEMRRMDDGQRLQYTLQYAGVMAEALDPVIANHIESRTPILLEGDFLLPSLAVRPRYGNLTANGLVRALFVYETEEQQILQNYLLREGAEQPQRARASWHYSEWLRQEAERLGIPTLSARPWDTALERAIAALEKGSFPPADRASV